MARGRARIERHGANHICGGSDPIPGICDLVAILPGSSRLDLLIPAVGDLTFWYRMGDTFAFPSGTTTVTGALADSSAFTLPIGGVPHNLDYVERNTTGGWSTGNRPTLDVAHTDLGAADDGACHLTYDRGVAFGGNLPCAFFRGDTDALASFEPSVSGQPSGYELKTLVFMFKIDTDAPGSGRIVTNYEDAGGGAGGWYVNYGEPATDVLQFVLVQSGGGSFHLETPGPLVRDQWYMAAVTRDTATSPATWTLWLDATAVDTTTSALVDHGFASALYGLTIGNSGPGENDRPFKGQIDEVAGYASVLTAVELGQLYAAATGASSDAEDTVLTSDGSGGTTWAFPTTKVDGTRYDEILTGTNLTSTDNSDGTVTLDAAATGGGGAAPDDSACWMPLTSTVAGDDVLVFDADHSLIPTLVPL